MTGLSRKDKRAWVKYLKNRINLICIDRNFGKESMHEKYFHEGIERLSRYADDRDVHDIVHCLVDEYRSVTE